MHTLTERELATTLAALRYWQRHGARQMLTSRNRLDVDDVATDGGTLEPLTVSEIDSLCERLNVSPAERPVHTHKGCGGVVFYDAWVDSNDELAGGPFDNCICGTCEHELGSNDIETGEG